MSSMVAVAVAAGVLGGWFGVEGSGRIKEEARQVGEFTGVEVGGPVEAEVKIGPARKVTLIADDNLLPMVKTKVKDGVLRTELTGSVRPTRGIKLIVVTPKLDRVGASGGSSMRAQVAASKSFKVSGSGGANLDVAGIDAETLRVDLSGGVDAKLQGKAKSATYDLSGGVDFTAADLAVENAELDASGGVDAALTATNEVTGSASGGVSIKVKGRPAVKVSTSGGSSVISE